MGRVWNWHDLNWRGNQLRRGGRPLVLIEPDATYPGMWRVRRPDGSLTDMVNRTRAKEAAEIIALAHLNTHDGLRDSPPIARRA